MTKNAMKSTNEGDTFDTVAFGWDDATCQQVGIDRRLAKLAWDILNGLSKEQALYRNGYHEASPFELIASSPQYVHAMRVMVAQFTNGITIPEVIVMLRGIVLDDKIEPPTRVKAGSKLHEIASESLAKFREEYSKQTDELNPEQLERVIKHLEQTKAAAMAEGVIDVQIDGQTAEADTYLSDLM